MAWGPLQTEALQPLRTLFPAVVPSHRARSPQPWDTTSRPRRLPRRCRGVATVGPPPADGTPRHRPGAEYAHPRPLPGRLSPHRGVGLTLHDDLVFVSFQEYSFFMLENRLILKQMAVYRYIFHLSILLQKLKHPNKDF